MLSRALSRVIMSVWLPDDLESLLDASHFLLSDFFSLKSYDHAKDTSKGQNTAKRSVGKVLLYSRGQIIWNWIINNVSKFYAIRRLPLSLSLSLFISLSLSIYFSLSISICPSLFLSYIHVLI